MTCQKFKQLTHCPTAIWILRIIVGGLFIVSGFTKAIDPWGFVFKIEEYFNIWGISEPRSVILVIAIILSSYEFLFGFFLSTGCFKRTSPWFLLASMAFMLPLTAYIAIANPVSDCGCFGEFWKLSNIATFIKNILLTVAIVYLCRYNKTVEKSIFAPTLQWIVSIVSFSYILFISLFGYNVQPLIDFRQYPTGTDMYAKTTDFNNDDDIIFRYEKNGKTDLFTIDNLPDSTWEFVERIENNSSADNEDAITIYDGNEDVTADVIAEEGDQLLLIIPEPIRADISYTYAINEFSSLVKRSGGSMIGLLATGEKGIDHWIDISMADYPCYTSEDTGLKELARGNMALVYLKDGIIHWKRTLSSFEFDVIEKMGKQNTPLDSFSLNTKHILTASTIAWAGILLAIILFGAFAKPLKNYFTKKKRKKNVTLHHCSNEISEINQ